MQEQWKTINGFENYQISNLGRLKRLEHWTEKPNGKYKVMTKHHYSEKIKSTFKSGIQKRYYYTCIYDSTGKKKNVLVHRLVAEAFVDNPRGLNEVDHIDRNPENNRADNLRWVTHVENQRNRNPRKKPKKYEHSEKFYRNHPNYKRKD